MDLAPAPPQACPDLASGTRRPDLAAADRAVRRAASAFAGWAAATPGERAARLHSAADRLDAARGRLRETAAAELGAAPAWTEFDVDTACRTLRQAATLAGAAGDREARGAYRARAIVRRQPAGVVLGVAPWNAPVVLAARAVAAPLACGNTVVLKGSELCPATHRAVAAVLQDALPPGVLTIVENAPERAEAVMARLIAHPAVRRINYTGSTRVGRLVAQMAARELKRCVLELSGKAPLVVLDDADLDGAAEAACFGAFLNQGQICMSTERVVVLEAVADAFVKRLVARARRLRAADPRREAAPLGAMIHAAAAARVAGLIADAVARGAVLRTGGEVAGAVMQPAVVDRVSADMALYHEESFGPVASVCRVRDEEEAVSVANDSAYGLAAAVFGRDEARALAVAGRIESGICHVNGPTVQDDPGMPFGGCKASGYGRMGGEAAVEEFTELRWITVRAAGTQAPARAGGGGEEGP